MQMTAAKTKAVDVVVVADFVVHTIVRSIRCRTVIVDAGVLRPRRRLRRLTAVRGRANAVRKGVTNTRPTRFPAFPRAMTSRSAASADFQVCRPVDKVKKRTVADYGLKGQRRRRRRHSNERSRLEQHFVCRLDVTLLSTTGSCWS